MSPTPTDRSKQSRHSNAINTYTTWHPVLRPVARLLVLAQLALVLQPLSALAQDPGQTPYNPVAQAQVQRLWALNQQIEAARVTKQQAHSSSADQFSSQLARTEELVRQLTPAPIQQAKASLKAAGTLPAPATPTPLASSPEQRQAWLQELQQQLSTLQSGHASVQAEFAATRAELLQKHLPADILARHDAAQAQFEQRAREFAQINTQLSTASRASLRAAIPWARPSETPEQQLALQDLQQFFQRNPNRPQTIPPEPGQLPWRTPAATQRLPAETAQDWQQTLHPELKNTPQAGQAHLLAQTPNTAGTSNIGPLQFSIPPDPVQAPTTADLAETDETQLTPTLKAKALELGNNPVNIHNWVRNSIEFAPTWGAIQSAQDTLDKKRGNAIDTASLEIALLRAAHIPARYQFGTIEVGAAQLQNWVGTTTSPEAAQQIIGQGGIASRALVEGGRITKIRMEHVWVQAYTNWAPSRGNRQGGGSTQPNITTPDGLLQHVNPNAQLNAWVPLDASYKQYSYTQGMDLKTAVPLDAQALLNAAQQGATVNAAQGWVQNLNQTAIQNQLSAYQTRLKTYIDASATGANSTVGDVIGKKIIPQQLTDMLAGSLPYATVQMGTVSSAVPSALQHRFTYQLSTAGWEGSPVLSYTEKLSKLVGKRLTLSYIPADQATADLIASYLPKPHADGSPILPSELPTSLPGYLIYLKAQINLDGVAVATSNTALPMGTDLQSTGGFTQLSNPSQWDLTSEESNVVGNATAIGISAGGISAAQLSQLKDRLTTTKTQLEAKNFTGLTGEQISGDLLTATIWSWFAAAESHNRLSQNQANMIENQGLSYGLFHAKAEPIYSWGVIRKVSFPGVNMDIGHVRPIGWSKDNDRNTWIAYNKLRGQYMSALEHAIPERFFNNPNQCNPEGSTTPVVGLPTCPQGISAVKAIALAAAQGQKIYTITREVYQANPNIVSSQLSAHSYRTQQAVQNALDVGHEVMIHEKPITQSGWTGAGYTTIDPETGSGGYMIDGGGNGGWLAGAVQGAAFALVVAMASFIAPLVVSGVAILWVMVALIAIANILATLYVLDNLKDPDARACYLGGLTLALGIAGLFNVASLIGKLLTIVGLGVGYTQPSTSNPAGCGL
jgi:hypothetical protein